MVFQHMILACKKRLDEEGERGATYYGRWIFGASNDKTPRDLGSLVLFTCDLHTHKQKPPILYPSKLILELVSQSPRNTYLQYEEKYYCFVGEKTLFHYTITIRKLIWFYNPFPLILLSL